MRKIVTAVALAGALITIPLVNAPEAKAAYNLGTTSEHNVRVKVRTYALAQRGDGYCRGGTGPSCFDCSGLVIAAYRYAGRPLSVRTSTQLRNWTRATSLRYARPGDLLFYSGHVEIFYKPGYAIAAHRPGIPVKVTPIRRSGLLKVGKAIY